MRQFPQLAAHCGLLAGATRWLRGSGSATQYGDISAAAPDSTARLLTATSNGVCLQLMLWLGKASLS
jgi:hypothetical protein